MLVPLILWNTTDTNSLYRTYCVRMSSYRYIKSFVQTCLVGWLWHGSMSICHYSPAICSDASKGYNHIHHTTVLLPIFSFYCIDHQSWIIYQTVDMHIASQRVRFKWVVWRIAYSVNTSAVTNKKHLSWFIVRYIVRLSPTSLNYFMHRPS